MRQKAIPLFIGLGGGGAIVGALLGELAFRRGSGVFGAIGVGIVGLILAWMLLASRPGEEVAMAEPVEPPAARRRAAATPQRTVPAATLRVKKSGEAGKRGEGRR